MSWKGGRLHQIFIASRMPLYNSLTNSHILNLFIIKLLEFTCTCYYPLKASKSLVEAHEAEPLQAPVPSNYTGIFLLPSPDL